MLTHCENCEHLHPESRKARRERTALCLKHPRVVRTDMVFRDITDRDEPFARCININLGACPCFEPVKG